MIKVLGILDLLSALWVILLNWDLGNLVIGSLLGLYLLIKGYLFRDSFVSYFDIAAGIFMFVMIIGLHTKYSYLFAALYLGQKGIMSFL